MVMAEGYLHSEREGYRFCYHDPLLFPSLFPFVGFGFGGFGRAGLSASFVANTSLPKLDLESLRLGREEGRVAGSLEDFRLLVTVSTQSNDRAIH